MSELRLISSRKQPLKPLIEAALNNELRLLEAGLRRTQQRLHDFEAQYGFSTSEFVQRFENNRLGETLDFDEWIGEHRLLKRLEEKADTLRDSVCELKPSKLEIPCKNRK